MPLETFESIFTQFPANTAQQWKDKILSDLKGGEFEKLITSNADGIQILPFYTKENADKYRLAIPSKKNKGWLVTERIKVNDAKEANAKSLHALQNGAMAIVFDMQQKNVSKEDTTSLLKDILLDIAPVYFGNYAEANKMDLETAAPGSCIATVIVPQLESKSDELTYALAKGIGQPGETIRIQFSIGNNFFLEIAKLRTFRWLWKQVNDIHSTKKEALLFCETGFQNRSDDDENNNILRNTTEAMSAIIGGCDALIVNPHNNDESSGFGKRIARNVQNILLFESDFGILEDSGKGAYFIEYLTWSLSNKVWEKLNAS